MIFAGVEGGATQSKLVLIKIHEKSVEKIIELDGEHLNCLLRGLESTCEYVAKLIITAAEKIGLELPIDGVGMGLSGAENEKISLGLIEIFESKFSHVAKKCFVTTDAGASIATAFKNGGMVIIAGTGSACRYVNKNDETFCSGGHGHLIGDGGGGFWITQNAIRTIFDDDDGLEPSKIPTKFLKELILEHFQIKDIKEMLNLLYGVDFNKAYIASFCKKIAENATKDPLCKLLFEQSGDILAKHFLAVSKNFDQDTRQNVPVLLVGSVFKSWEFIKPGFEKTLREKKINVKKVAFYSLTESSALGAALFAVKKTNLETNFEYNTVIFIDSI